MLLCTLQATGTPAYQWARLALPIVGITERAGEGGAGREIGDDVPLETEGEGEGEGAWERGVRGLRQSARRHAVPPSLRPSVRPSTLQLQARVVFSQGWFMGRGRPFHATLRPFFFSPSLPVLICQGSASRLSRLVVMGTLSRRGVTGRLPSGVLVPGRMENRKGDQERLETGN